MNTQSQMEQRAAQGLDPISGRPMQCKPPISTWTDGTCRDADGVIVTLSEFGDWIPVVAS